MFAGTYALFVPNTHENRILKICTATLIVALVWVFPDLFKFKFARPKDKGILSFGTLVCIWSLFNLDFNYFAPSIYSDPIGAIIGNAFPEPKLYGKKTVAGSLSIFIVSLLTTYALGSNLLLRISTSIAITILELFGGEYDNLALTTPMLTLCILNKIIRVKNNYLVL
ncbi:hypothetical protein RS030_182706 [Cryptosporidium xiaoi]|uniref:Phosphatidate cytidylyltransferase n=1 Tax=Cryptosporidium xiaoi TaxID=659607 RepID=A0AAV9XZS4_9CRYT